MITALLSFLLFSSLESSVRAEDSCRSQLELKAAAPSLVFVSDTQEPIWIEKLWLKHQNNREVTRMLFDSIAQQRPDAVFHGGDLVAMGSSSADWKSFWDAFLPVSRLKIPLVATPGNHEFMFSSRKGLERFQEHFPSFARCQWQSVQIGPLAVVLLNSNFSEMSLDQIGKQNQWLEAELAYLDQAAETQAIILLTHYSPYTNGKVVSPSIEVQTHFLPGYRASKKTRLMLSGHSHVFEHFREGGKDFMVIGGGGGLLHPMKSGPARRYEDLYANSDSRGFFHYLSVKHQNGKLQVTVMKYQNAQPNFFPSYSLVLP